MKSRDHTQCCKERERERERELTRLMNNDSDVWRQMSPTCARQQQKTVWQKTAGDWWRGLRATHDTRLMLLIMTKFFYRYSLFLWTARMYIVALLAHWRGTRHCLTVWTLRDPSCSRNSFRRLLKTHLLTLYWNIEHVRGCMRLRMCYTNLPLTYLYLLT